MTPAPGSSVFVLAVLISTSLLYSSCSELKGLLVCRWLKHLCTTELHCRCTKITADPKLKAETKQISIMKVARMRTGFGCELVHEKSVWYNLFLPTSVFIPSASVK